MSIPSALLDEIRKGSVVLFFGAGASIGATSPSGKKPLNGNQLRDLLSDKFLNGQYKSDTLQWVSELSISTTSLPTVQDYITTLFEDLEPANFHELLPTFSWKGIITTNYDRIIEKAYERAKEPIQDIVPIISNLDNIEDKLRSPTSLPLLKIHGCITRNADMTIPFILTVDQYNQYKPNRETLFKTFYEWGTSQTFVFIGHAMQDPDLRYILLDVSRELPMRKRFYLIKPGIMDDEKDLWGEKRITSLNCTFQSFLEELNKEIPSNTRSLVKIIDLSHPIKGRFVTSEDIPDPVKDLLNHDVEYIHPAMESNDGSTEMFYRGAGQNWYPIVQDLDVSRELYETIIYDAVLKQEEDRVTKVELYIIKGEAGAGKTVLLRRVAWDASISGNVLCLYARINSTISFESIVELHRLCNERIFLFIDPASDHVELIAYLLKQAKKIDLPLTIISSDRYNEWNINCETLNVYVTDKYDLRYLRRQEIINLLDLLSKHNSLGPNLITKTQNERIIEFEERAGRQLLVALHEATMGEKFSEILLDEYESILPIEARSIYLTVCFLNRLMVPVRAGLIARVHGISFDKFKIEFYAPLEHIVTTVIDRYTKDVAYITRHPEIAEIVYNQVLKNPKDKYNQYIKVLKYLNVSYGSDHDSFRKLIRARALSDTFPNFEDVNDIYQIAVDVSPNDSYVYQQMANYERIRPNGNLRKAYELLNHAKDLDKTNPSISHTLAEVLKLMAQKSERPLERQKLRDEAKSILRKLPKYGDIYKYSINTIAKIFVDEFKDLLENSSNDRQIDDCVRNIEKILEEGLQKYPNEYHLKSTESEFSTLLKDSDRSRKALISAFETNPKDSYLASRLANLYQELGDELKVQEILKRALDKNRGDFRLNYKYAQYLQRNNSTDLDNLIYHFHRSYTPGDQNYEAQFWHARYLFEQGDSEKQKDMLRIFQDLRNSRMDYDERNKIRSVILVGSSPKTFYGNIKRIEMSHGFISLDGSGIQIFFHQNKNEKDWSKLKKTKRISFNIAFNFGGPMGIDIKLLNNIL